MVTAFYLIIGTVLSKNNSNQRESSIINPLRIIAKKPACKYFGYASYFQNRSNKKCIFTVYCISIFTG